MLHLQQKAHYSLEEFRRGNTSIVGGGGGGRYSEPISPDNDNDELALLGGKTRLVAKIEPSSPQILERSPQSQNPIVPLPLSPTMQNHLDPSVVEYLQSFNHPHSVLGGGGGPGSAGSQISPQGATFTDVDLSPVSAYGMTTISPQTYQQEPSPFMGGGGSQQQQQHQQTLRHGGPSHHSLNGSGSGTTLRDVTMGPAASVTSGGGGSGSNGHSGQRALFPQYFPVFDYGGGMMGGGGGGGSGTYPPTTPILDTPTPAGLQRKLSGSPEGNMHTTWQDFVNTLQMS